MTPFDAKARADNLKALLLQVYRHTETIERATFQIAAALAEARASGLEEAAKVVDVKAEERRDVYATGLAEWCSLCEVRETLRAMKHVPKTH